MEKVETGPTVRILRIFTDAAVDDPAVEETDVFAGIGLDAAVGAIADGSADSDQIAAVGGGDAQCSAAVEVTEVDGDLTAAVEAQYAAGAIALLDGMADPEAGEIKVFAAGKAQDVGIAGLGDDAAVCKAAALQKQVPDSEELQLRTVIVGLPVPVVVLYCLAVGGSFCEIILAVCQTDQAVGTDGSEQLIHRRNIDHGLRKIGGKGEVLCIGDPDGGCQGGRLRC